MTTRTIKAKDLHAADMASDPIYRAAYDALEDEFALVNLLVSVCSKHPNDRLGERRPKARRHARKP